jgi:hypothetical protein
MNRSLMRKLVLRRIVFACAMAGTAHAITLSSGPIYGATAQNRVVCSVINMGSASISFGNGQNVIFSTFNGAVPRTSTIVLGRCFQAECVPPKRRRPVTKPMLTRS